MANAPQKAPNPKLRFFIAFLLASLLAFFAQATQVSAAITHVGVGAQATGVTDTVVSLPGGVQEDDLLIMLCGATSDLTDPFPSWSATGWTVRTRHRFPATATAFDPVIAVLYKVAGSSESNPTVDQSSDGGFPDFGCAISAYRGVDTSSPWNITASTGGNGPLTSFTPASVTTLTNGAWVLSFIAHNDDTAQGLASGSEQGFTPIMSGASYDFGGNHAAGMAHKEIATAGSVTMPTWEQTSSQGDNDDYVSITEALTPAGAGAPASHFFRRRIQQ